jgi:hypothetical protein
METSHEIAVTALDAAHRRAVEEIIGAALQQNQLLIISVAEVSATPGAATPRRAQSIGDWTSVYEGLTDEEVETIDREAKTRANLTRHLP